MHILIDGYNLVRYKYSGLVTHAQWVLFCTSIAHYKKLVSHSITVVLDGDIPEDFPETLGVSVQGSGHRCSADQYIINYCERAPERRGATIVITSDRELQKIIARFGVTIGDSRLFWRILDIAQPRKSIITTQTARKTTQEYNPTLDLLFTTDHTDIPENKILQVPRKKSRDKIFEILLPIK